MREILNMTNSISVHEINKFALVRDIVCHIRIKFLLMLSMLLIDF